MEQTLLDVLRQIKFELDNNIKTAGGEDALLERINDLYLDIHGNEIIKDNYGNYYRDIIEEGNYIRVNNFIELVDYLIRDELIRQEEELEELLEKKYEIKDNNVNNVENEYIGSKSFYQNLAYYMNIEQIINDLRCYNININSYIEYNKESKDIRCFWRMEQIYVNRLLEKHGFTFIDKVKSCDKVYYNIKDKVSGQELQIGVHDNSVR